MPLVLTARIVASKGAEDEVERLLRATVEPSRSEPGMLTYELSRSDDEPGSFFMYEVFRDRAAFVEHHQSAHVQALLRDGIQTLTETIETTTYTRLET